MKTEKPKLGRPVTGEAMTQAEKQKAYRERGAERVAGREALIERMRRDMQNQEDMIQSMKKELAEKEKIITALQERIVYLKG